jgi:hypothetical protein
VLNQYKTFDKYGQYTINLTKSSTLKTQLKKYITDNKLKAGDYLFSPTLRHESGFSKAVRDTFLEVTGKNLNINMLRKIYVSYINELPANQRTQAILQQVAKLWELQSTRLLAHIQKYKMIQMMKNKML